MADVLLAASARDLPRLEPLIARLSALKLDVAALPRPDAPLVAARAVVVVWTKRSCADEQVLRAASYGWRTRALVTVRLQACTPPIQFHHTAIIEAGLALADPRHVAWAQLIRQIEALVGRPGLSSFNRTAALRSPDGLVAWANAHRHDPLAEEALRLAATIREEEAARAARKALEAPEWSAAWRSGRRGRIARLLDRHGFAIAMGAMGVAGVACAALLYLVLSQAPTTVVADDGAAVIARSAPAATIVQRKAPTVERGGAPMMRAVASQTTPGGVDQPSLGAQSFVARRLATESESAAPQVDPNPAAAVTDAQYAARRADSAARIAARMAQHADDGLDGYGMVGFANGALYRGQTSSGRPSGFGVRTDPPADGGAEFLGMIQGAFGRTVWPDGARFSGYHRDGRPNGPGALVLPDGETIEGAYNGAAFGRGMPQHVMGERPAPSAPTPTP